MFDAAQGSGIEPDPFGCQASALTTRYRFFYTRKECDSGMTQRSDDDGMM